MKKQPVKIDEGKEAQAETRLSNGHDPGLSNDSLEFSKF